MDSRDRLELLEGQLALIDAVTRAIAYNSPSAAEEHRAQLNREVLDLREELGLNENDEPQEPEAPADVPAAQQEAELGEPVAAEPGVVEQSGPADEEHKQPDVPADAVAPEGEDADQGGAEQARSDEAAVEANPGLVDSRGDVGAGRPENATERGQLAVEQEDLAGEE
jgi:hypothetical protein